MASTASEGVDVVVPVRRPGTVGRLLEALADGDRRPDLVSLVGHEVPLSVDTRGLPLRLLRPRSVSYAVGEHDVALRRNVGGWASPLPLLVFLDDDVVPARDTLSSCARLLAGGPVAWGHHRLLDLRERQVQDVLALPASAGRSRESGVNRWHGWESCYGGMLAVRRAAFLSVGGFDMAYAGRHAGEDQDLGRRLARGLHGTDRVFIHEPPYAWHPVVAEPWAAPGWTNLCRQSHRELPAEVDGLAVLRCEDCPWSRVVGDPPRTGLAPCLPFSYDRVEVEIFAL